MRRVCALLVGVILLAAVPAGAGTGDGGEPPDYTTLNAHLSEATYDDIAVEQLRIPMDDGVEIFVEVSRPDPASHPGVKVPVIVKAGPYHGTIDTRVATGELPEPTDADGNALGLTGYFPPRGYAVAVVDWRGTGDSGGCFDQLGARDANDLKAVIEWLAAREWSNGRVGIIGLSMPGHAAGVAAAMQPEGLETAVIIAGGGSMYDSQFQRGVPFFLHFASPWSVYPALSVARYSPAGVPPFTSGDEASTQYTSAGCGFVAPSALAGPNMVTGQYVQWHAERDFNAELAAADMPIFLAHGVDDISVRMSAAEWFFRDRAGRFSDKVWIGPWGHTVRTRGAQWTGALHAWFDRHLQQRDVSTGPAVEAFFETGDVLTDDAWAPADGSAWYPDATDMTLKPVPPAQTATAAFTARGNADPAKSMASPTDGVVEHLVGSSLQPHDGGIEFTSEPLADDLVLFGLPQLRLAASVTAPMVNLVATMWRQPPEGPRRLLDVCAIQPLLRDGVDKVTPITPGEVMTLQPQCFTTAHHLQAGEELVLRIGTGSHHHISPATADARITVFTGPDGTVYTAPARPGATTYPDPIPAEDEL